MQVFCKLLLWFHLLCFLLHDKTVMTFPDNTSQVTEMFSIMTAIQRIGLLQYHIKCQLLMMITQYD